MNTHIHIYIYIYIYILCIYKEREREREREGEIERDRERETGESTKRRKYSMVPLLPAVMSHLGRFGTGMQTIIKSVNRQPKDAERSAAIVEMYQAIGVEVQKANVAQLQAAGTLM